ncbi:hypothetical protein VNO77_01031 [Canavalia gladiata]|uniref:Uncharacterized protein n=1 Tax=Canavalia gladiata TaxID=3824 RepID=A0AAN9MQG9_CANGL
MMDGIKSGRHVFQIPNVKRRRNLFSFQVLILEEDLFVVCFISHDIDSWLFNLSTGILLLDSLLLNQPSYRFWKNIALGYANGVGYVSEFITGHTSVIKLVKAAMTFLIISMTDMFNLLKEMARLELS